MEVTQRMIDIVADEWEKQHRIGMGIDLSPDTCDGMTQKEIDETIDWLYSNN